MKQREKRFGFCGVSMVVGAGLVLVVLYGVIPAFRFAFVTLPNTTRATKYLCEAEAQRAADERQEQAQQRSEGSEGYVFTHMRLANACDYMQ